MAVDSSTAGGTRITNGAVYRIADKVPLLFCGDGRPFTTTVASEIMTMASLPQPCISQSFSPEWHKQEVLSGPKKSKRSFFIFKANLMLY